MFLPIERLERHASILIELAREMNELAELRRALCLQMTKRAQAVTRRPVRHAAGSLQRRSPLQHFISAEPK